ncbi:MAG: YfiR family protein [Nitrospira sp.]|nr:YfiR family protein [Nitrospira sp.]
MAILIRSQLRDDATPGYRPPLRTAFHFMGRVVSRLTLLIAGLGLIVYIWPLYSAQAQPSNESLLKVAFLYNFAKFVEWPAQTLPNAADPFTICVIGTDQMTQAASHMLQGKQIQGHLVKTRALQAPNNISTCHILFVDASTAAISEPAWRSLSHIPILTVGETDQFIHGGGIIKFFVENDTLRFEINPQAAEQAQLKISSKLLKLGRIIETK